MEEVDHSFEAKADLVEEEANLINVINHSAKYVVNLVI